ncbi:MAG: isocitrate/isopropylmalate dehydrogenase family protein [Myxococcota bacterium]
MKHRVTLIEGDGIGPEVTGAAAQVLEAAGAPIEWERVVAGAGAFEQFGHPLPDDVLDSLRRNRIGLKGPLGTPKGGGYRSANVQLRQKLQLFVGWRPVASLPGVTSRYDNVDLVVLRENTEGLYAGIEHQVRDDTVVSLKLSSRDAAMRIARWAFEFARNHGRRKVTVCHKKSVLPLGDGAFVDAFFEVGQDYPFLEQEEARIDQVAMSLAQRGGEGYDVLLLENLYGDIFSDLCAGLVGGLGVVPGANIGHDVALFEAVHGTAPDIAGRGIANPLAVLLSGVLMVEWMGAHDVGRNVRQAIDRVLAEGRVRTGDLGGSASTAEFTAALIDALETA